MKVVGLLSGGKDSCYNLCHAARQGHVIIALATLAPPHGTEELDSYMYQTVGHDAVHLVAQAMDLPLYRREISGKPVDLGSSYGSRLPHQSPLLPTSNHEAASTSSLTQEQDETEDLHQLLLAVKHAHPDVEGVSVGAILSNYQRVRVEHVCMRANLKLLPLAYLWQRDQSDLLDEMCNAGLQAVLVKVAGIGLEAKHLGKSLSQMRPTLKKLNELYGSHVCGEGGEYETLTLDCPLFKRRIALDEVTTQIHSDSGFASVAYVQIKRAHLEEKSSDAATLQDVRIPNLLDALGERTRLAAAKDTEESALDARPLETQRARDRLSQGVSSMDIEPLSHARRGDVVAVGGIHGVSTGQGEEQSKAERISAVSITSQVLTAFQRLQAALARHDLCLAHVQHLNLYLESQDDFAEVNRIYSALFGSDPPSRACVGMASGASIPGSPGGDGAPALHQLQVSPREQPRILMDALALDDGLRYSSQGEVTGRAHIERKVVHVQGRSYWAAANIGPYSQSVRAGSRLTISGQIGLHPADLTLAEDAATQHAVALQHARRVLKVALDAPSHQAEHWIESCVCWLEDPPAPDGQGTCSALLAARRSRLSMARRALRAQCSANHVQSSEANSASDAEDDLDEASHHEEWMGPHSDVVQIPTAYAFLPCGALPRGAAAEWQLTAHDGRRSTVQARARVLSSNDAASGADSDSEDEDADSKPDLPIFSNAHELVDVEGRTWRLSWRSAQASKGTQGFAVVHASRVEAVRHEQTGADPPSEREQPRESDSAEQRKRILQSALAIRVLFSERLDAQAARDFASRLLGDNLSAGSGLPALTFVPVVCVHSHSEHLERVCDYRYSKEVEI